MRRITTCRTTAALGVAVVAFAVVATVVQLEGTPHQRATPAHHAQPPHHRAIPTTTAPAAGLVASRAPQAPGPPGQTATGSTTTTAPPAVACPVQPLAGDGTWPVVDGASGSARAPACGILTNVEVPSRTQWITTGSPASCTWTTYSTPTADAGTVIATHTGGGQAIMGFTDAVAAVRSTGCGPWVAWPASDSYWLVPPSPSHSAFGDGTYAFWLGISDGTWQATGGPTCRWAVLRSFTGTAADVASSGSGGGPTSVTMAMPTGAEQAGDNHGGFTSDGCGTWSYVGGGSLG